jgi:hypothetical protein
MLRKYLNYFPFLLGALILLVAYFSWNYSEATAQCGSQASSCKNCHEVQAQDPVNNDGSGWHQSHAFGDFCYICHAGNQQATDKQAAHTGMVDPLSDINASCQQCHPNDLMQRAEVYASTLGIQLGSSNQTPPSAQPTPTTAAEPPLVEKQSTDLQAAGIVINDPNTIDYVQRYNELVLGSKPINWGNIILLVMIGALVISGGGFVLRNEHLINISFKETKSLEGQYPADIVDMIPDIARLKPDARKSLHSLLKQPEATAEVLNLIDKLITSKSSDSVEKNK